MSLFSKERQVFIGDYKWKRILDELKISFVIIDSLKSGWILFDLGYEAEAIKLARKNLAILRENNITKIITNSNDCFNFFLKLKELPDSNIEVELIYKQILERMKNKKLITNNEKIIFHSNSSSDEEREILKMLGYKIAELEDNVCGVGYLKEIDLELAGQVADNFLGNKEFNKIKKLIVSEAECYDNLKEKAKEKGIEIFDIAEIIAQGLGIKREEIEKEENKKQSIEKKKEINNKTSKNAR